VGNPKTIPKTIDVAYHRNYLNQIVRDLDNYNDDEYARALLRMVNITSPKVMLEKEFYLVDPSETVDRSVGLEVFCSDMEYLLGQEQNFDWREYLSCKLGLAIGARDHLNNLDPNERSLNDAAVSLGIVSEGQELTEHSLKAWAKRTNSEPSKIDELKVVLESIMHHQEKFTKNDGVLDTITPSLYFARKGLKIIGDINNESEE
jgi:hypothetical protein